MPHVIPSDLAFRVEFSYEARDGTPRWVPGSFLVGPSSQRVPLDSDDQAGPSSQRVPLDSDDQAGPSSQRVPLDSDDQAGLGSASGSGMSAGQTGLDLTEMSGGFNHQVGGSSSSTDPWRAQSGSFQQSSSTDPWRAQSGSFQQGGSSGSHGMSWNQEGLAVCYEDLWDDMFEGEGF